MTNWTKPKTFFTEIAYEVVCGGKVWVTINFFRYRGSNGIINVYKLGIVTRYHIYDLCSNDKS